MSVCGERECNNITVQNLITELERTFVGQYDVTTSSTNPLLTANYVCDNNAYILFRDLTVWGSTDKEVIHLFSFGPEDSFEDIICRSWDSAIETINPSSKHRSSTVTTILICDPLDDDIRTKAKGFVHRESFKFTLNGTVTHYVLALDIRTGEVSCNKHQSDLARSVSNAFRRCSR